MTLQQSTLKIVDEKVAAKHLLKHSFYQMWTEGKLSIDALRGYAKQYYRQVEAFPRYLGGVYAHCDDIDARREVLENLVEEDRGPGNHLDLWMSFAEGLGVSREEVLNAKPLPKTQEAVDTFCRLSIESNAASGMAALYAYESMVPEVAQEKIDGLKKFYQIDDAKTLSYFVLHEKMDREHRQSDRRVLEKMVKSDDDSQTAQAATDEALGALWTLLDGIQEAYVD